MAIGMILGILVGAIAPVVNLDPGYLKPVGQLFINLVRMVVVPLVLTTLVAGAASVGDVGRLAVWPERRWPTISSRPPSP